MCAYSSVLEFKLKQSYFAALQSHTNLTKFQDRHVDKMARAHNTNKSCVADEQISTYLNNKTNKSNIRKRMKMVQTLIEEDWRTKGIISLTSSRTKNPWTITQKIKRLNGKGMASFQTLQLCSMNFCAGYPASI